MGERNDLEEADAAGHFYGGSASAYESASKMVLDMARDAFAVGKDAEARTLRKLAGLLARSGVDEREKQKEQQTVCEGHR